MLNNHGVSIHERPGPISAFRRVFPLDPGGLVGVVVLNLRKHCSLYMTSIEIVIIDNIHVCVYYIYTHIHTHMCALSYICVMRISSKCT